MKKELFYVVIGRPKLTTPQTLGDDAVGIFDSVELAAEFARSLAGFRIYQGENNNFKNAALMVRSSASGEVEWVGGTPPAPGFNKLFGLKSGAIGEQGEEEDISDEEHLDWQV